jgi:putative redox protein
MARIQVERKKGNFIFEAKDEKGHTVLMDSSAESGGVEAGFRPMQMLLAAMGGCSGMDIVSILTKQRQTVDGFSMTIEGQRGAAKEPSLWESAHLVFRLEGAIDPEKARKACDLSLEKYCSVATTLREAGCKITWEVRVNENESIISK